MDTYYCAQRWSQGGQLPPNLQQNSFTIGYLDQFVPLQRYKHNMLVSKRGRVLDFQLIYKFYTHWWLSKQYYLPFMLGDMLCFFGPGTKCFLCHPNFHQVRVRTRERNLLDECDECGHVEIVLTNSYTYCTFFYKLTMK